MLYLNKVLLTRRTVQRQFPTIKGWTTVRLRVRVREERKANQLAGKEGPKGFGKGRVDPPIQAKEVHAGPPLQKEPQPQKEEHQKILPENDEPSELEITFISLFHLYQSSRMKYFNQISI